MVRKRRTEVNNIKFWRLPQLGQLDLLHASFRRHTFNRHFHDGYAMGVIEAGALGYHYRGKEVVAGTGDINFAIPGEMHNGYPVDDYGWQYRMFYVDMELMRQVAMELADKYAAPPFFKEGVFHDRALAGEIHSLHRIMERPEAMVLECESRLLGVLSQVILRHSAERPKKVRSGNEKRAVAIVKDYIRDNYRDNIRLEELSDVSGLSRFHLLRVFKLETGLPPHAYHNMIRVSEARKQLKAGNPILHTAHETGFFDQSHLNRLFKHTYGITPGQYRNCVQDH